MRSIDREAMNNVMQFIWAAFNPVMCVYVLAFNGSIYLLVPLIPVLFLAYRVGKKYLKSARELKRLDRLVKEKK
jgi:hypothetical protein